MFFNTKKEKDQESIDQLQTELIDLREQVSSHDRQLTMTFMKLMEKEKLIDTILAELRKIQDDPSIDTQAVVRRLINEMTMSLNSNRWKEFEFRFHKVNKDFLPNLLADFPDLTLNERKLSIFLAMDMSTKEISGITGQSVHTLTIARGRMRKKFGLAHTGGELNSFLHKYLNK
jgi:hypothetical protein